MPPPTPTIDVEAILRGLADREDDDPQAVERVRRRLFGDAGSAVAPAPEVAAAGQVRPGPCSAGTVGAHQAPPVPSTSPPASPEILEIP